MTPPNRTPADEPRSGPVGAAARAAGSVIGVVQAGVGFASGAVRLLLTKAGEARTSRRRAQVRAQQTLPSLYERHPAARQATRRQLGVTVVPLDQIVGTERNPSQNTADFLPLSELRGHNWRARWQRINRAVDRLAVLPPVSLLKVGDEYFVSDGHNRVAAALVAGAVGIDAEVTELILPGIQAGPRPGNVASSLAEGVLLREAATGRLSRTAETAELGGETGDRQEILRTSRGDDDATPRTTTSAE